MALGQRSLPATDKEVMTSFLHIRDCNSVLDAIQVLRSSSMLTRGDGFACRPFKQSRASLISIELKDHCGQY